jgi:hypothetical protein
MDKSLNQGVSSASGHVLDLMDLPKLLLEEVEKTTFHKGIGAIF